MTENPKVVECNTMLGRKLFLTFSNGEERIFDVLPYIAKGGVFSYLVDWKEFYKVSVINGGYGIEWESGADLSRDTLYLVSEAFIHPAKKKRDAANP